MVYRSTFLSAIAVLAVYGGTVLNYPFASENIKPIERGQGMPGNLDSTKVPLMISLGFDDNKYADGVDWVRDTLLAGRFNNKGKGNAATYDGTPMKADFYVIGSSDMPWSATPHTFTVPKDRPVTDAWRRAYDAGLGVNNHTWSHNYNLSDLAYDQWKNELPPLTLELGLCHQYLINVAGIPHEHIYGFRTPYLANSAANNDSFRATKELGMIYDCTLDNQMQGNQPAVWAYPAWPGTMDAGWLFPTVATKGLWQVPNGIYQLSDGAVFSDKAFDSGPKGWPGGATTEGFLNQMKSAIKFAYGKNRAAVDLGFHSDYYSAKAQNTSGSAANKFTTSLANRRAALVQLLDWIEKDLPDARVVTGIDIVRWMRVPTALDDLSRNKELIIAEDGAKVNKLTAPVSIKTGSGSLSSVSGNTASVTVADSKGNWKIDAFAGMEWAVSQFEGTTGISVSYKSDLPLRLNLVQSDISSGHYGIGLPSTLGKTKTVKLPISQNYFEPPRPYTTTAPLDFAKVVGVSVVAQVLDSTMTGSFTADVSLIGGGGTSVGTVTAKSVSPVVVTGFSRTSLSLDIPQSGAYTVELFSLNGRLIISKEISAQTGVAMVEWTESLAKGPYGLRITGAGVAVTSRQNVQ